MKSKYVIDMKQEAKDQVPEGGAYYGQGSKKYQIYSKESMNLGIQVNSEIEAKRVVAALNIVALLKSLKPKQDENVKYWMDFGDNKPSLFSKRIWRNKATSTIEAVQSYHWVPRVIVIDEANNRRILDDLTLEDFFKQKDQWELVRDWDNK